MSSIGSTGAGQGLFQFFQSLSVQNNQPSPTAATTTAANTRAVTSTTPTTAAGGNPAVQGAPHHHGHHGGGGGFAKIEAAVTDALKQAQSDGTTDPNKAIQDAIERVFQSGGQIGANGATGAAGTPGGAPPADPTATNAGGTAAAEAGDSARHAFFQTLKSFGVDPQQFRNDFLAAVKDAKGGQADPGAAFRSFPNGTAVDTTA